MKIELLYFDDCPHWRTADERLRAVAAARGLRVERRRVTTAEQASAIGFLGSPTILLDGHDPFAREGEAIGLSCRVYDTPDGLAGSPTVDQLERALDEASPTTSGRGGPLPAEGVRRVYDRIGRLQDTQACYEEPAIDELVAHAAFDTARRVVEVGCGTGRLARRLLDQQLPTDATYLGLELSTRMAAIARDRLRPHATRATVEVADAVRDWPAHARHVDHVVATYVFDLLDATATGALLDQVRGTLGPDGRLCVVGLTHGADGIARFVSRAWTALWQRKPAIVGGCRPIRLADTLTARGWHLDHHDTVTARAVTSEIVVARPSGKGLAS